jgi:molecular chaperone GrpE
MDETTTKPDSHDIEAPDPEARAGVAEPVAGSDEASALQRQRDEYYDLLLRKTAEFDNYRKRIDRERLTLAEATAASVVEELLPLMDDLERALQADPGTEGAEAYRRGVELIHRQLGEILRKRGLVAIEAVGTDFDPHLHQAVAYDAVEGRRDGEIIDELRRGYRLGDRLLRPSMVRVAKG